MNVSSLVFSFCFVEISLNIFLLHLVLEPVVEWSVYSTLKWKITQRINQSINQPSKMKNNNIIINLNYKCDMELFISVSGYYHDDARCFFFFRKKYAWKEKKKIWLEEVIIFTWYNNNNNNIVEPNRRRFFCFLLILIFFFFESSSLSFLFSLYINWPWYFFNELQLIKLSLHLVLLFFYFEKKSSRIQSGGQHYIFISFVRNKIAHSATIIHYHCRRRRRRRHHHHRKTFA